VTTAESMATGGGAPEPDASTFSEARNTLSKGITIDKGAGSSILEMAMLGSKISTSR
jgi:hypothetical protein